MNAEDLRSVQAPLRSAIVKPQRRRRSLCVRKVASAKVSAARSKQAKHSSWPGCIRPPVAADRLRAQATCCSKPWLPAPE